MAFGSLDYGNKALGNRAGRSTEPVETRAFHHGAHAMNGEAERDRSAAKADAIALLTILEDTTPSRSVAERCAKAKAVLS